MDVTYVAFILWWFRIKNGREINSSLVLGAVF